MDRRVTLMVALAGTLVVAGCDDEAGARDDLTPPEPPSGHDGGPADEPDLGPGDYLPGPAYPSAPAQNAAIPAVTGGTLLATTDGLLVAADAARDQLYVTDPSLADVHIISLEAGDEPGRLVEDADGRVHVALRRGGALITLDAAREAVAERRPVCPAPRGVAYEPGQDAILVACAGGDLVTMPAAGGAETARAFVATDLRDVVVTETATYVTRFRSAELLTLDDAGAIVERREPISASVRAGFEGMAELTPNVAWRTVATPSGDLLMLHQRSFSSPIDVAPESGGYGGGSRDLGCQSAVVHASVTLFPPAGTDIAPGPILSGVALAVDIAVDPTTDSFAVVSGGTGNAHTTTYRTAIAAVASPTDCAQPFSMSEGGVAVASTAEGLMVQQREPAALFRVRDDAIDRWAWLDPSLAVGSEGHDVFHEVTDAFVACASCHPEGGEDGHIWEFEGTPPRRTQTLLGNVMETLPFHWGGDQADLGAIMDSTFRGRMGGDFSIAQLDSLGDWLRTLPAIPAPETDATAVGAGAEVFATAGCESCHAGAMGTDNESVEFASNGEAIQVPMLVGVAHRAPWLHDGCAESLDETIDGSCIPEHVPLTALSTGETDALVAYLRSL